MGGNETSATPRLSAEEAHMLRGSVRMEGLAAMMSGLGAARSMLDSVAGRLGTEPPAVLAFRGGDFAEAMLLVRGGNVPAVSAEDGRVSVSAGGRTWRSCRFPGEAVSAADLGAVRGALARGNAVLLDLDLAEVPALAKACAAGSARALPEGLAGTRSGLQGLKAVLSAMPPSAVGVTEMARSSELLASLRTCSRWDAGAAPRGWSRSGSLFARADAAVREGRRAGDHAPDGPEAAGLRKWLRRFPPLDAAFGPPPAAEGGVPSVSRGSWTRPWPRVPPGRTVSPSARSSRPRPRDGRSPAPVRDRSRTAP